jgi:PAS domain-containing protein
VVDPLERELRAAVSNDQERQLELEMPTSGGLRWLHLRLVPTADDPLSPGSITVIASDITARKHAELRLSAGNAAFRALVEDSPDPIALIDSELRVAFVNDALVRAVGRAASTMLGRTIAEAGLFAELAGRWEEAVRTVLVRARAGSAPACCPSSRTTGAAAT